MGQSILVQATNHFAIREFYNHSGGIRNRSRKRFH